MGFNFPEDQKRMFARDKTAIRAIVKALNVQRVGANYPSVKSADVKELDALAPSYLNNGEVFYDHLDKAMMILQVIVGDKPKSVKFGEQG